MRKGREPISIGIFGHYGNRNLGDEAIIAAVIENLGRELASVRLIGFSMNPTDTTQRHGIAAYPIRVGATGQGSVRNATDSTEAPSMGEAGVAADTPAWRQRIKRALKAMPIVSSILRRIADIPSSLKGVVTEVGFLSQAYRNLKTIDVLLITGSNQLIDTYGGTAGFPYTLFKWSILARLAGARLAFVSVGAGPLSAPLSKVLLKKALGLSEYTSFRDEGSKALMRSLGYRGKCTVRPDLAHSLSLEPHAVAMPAASTRPTVCINPMPIYDERYWYVADDDKYRGYIEKLTEFSSRLLSDGYPVTFFATQSKDSGVIDDVLSALNKKQDGVSGRVAVKASESVAQLVDDISSGSIVVACRFHGVLLSLLAERPVVAICYHAKTRDLMADMGQEAYALDFETFSAEELTRCFKALEQDAAATVDKTKNRTRDYQTALRRQYREIARLLQAVPPASAAGSLGSVTSTRERD